VSAIALSCVKFAESAPSSSRAFHGRDMLCFSHDWHGDPLSKTHLMRLLAKNNRILWVNSIGYRTPGVSRRDIRRTASKLRAAMSPIREVERNVFVLNPIAIPLHGSPLARWVNRQWLGRQVRRAMRRLGFSKPINWVFNPAAASIAGMLGEEKIIYYCVDEYAAFHGVDSIGISRSEQSLLERADLVISSAESLNRVRKPSNGSALLVRHGVDYHHFKTALDDRTAIPPGIASLPRPILGYFGLMAGEWLDIELMVKVARRFSHGSVVMLGKSTTNLDALRAMRNIHILGHKPYETLPSYCKAFDVGLIPFPINEVTLNSNPLKAREYLAAGVPVISTAIPEVTAIGGCRVAHSHREFLEDIEASLREPMDRTSLSRRMAGESWESRLADIEDYFVENVAGKRNASYRRTA
jgi:glycosyltransferase involved in cell wall biosynthesis